MLFRSDLDRLHGGHFVEVEMCLTSQLHCSDLALFAPCPYLLIKTLIFGHRY